MEILVPLTDKEWRQARAFTKLNQEEFEKLRRGTQCEKSPTGFHIYTLSWTDGQEDGPCKYCEILYSVVHKGRTSRNPMRGGRTMATPEGMLTVREIAARAGVEPKILRRLLRKSFGGGKKQRYLWNKDDSQIEQIIAAAKGKPAKAEQPTTAWGEAEKKAKVVSAELTQPVAKKPKETKKTEGQKAVKELKVSDDKPQEGLEGELTTVGNFPPGAQPENDPFPHPNKG